MLKDYSYVFVLTYGRSGSTILMKILNAIDGFDIKGENHNALFHAFKSIEAVEKSRAQRGGSSTDPGTPWYGTPDIDAQAYRAAVLEAFVRDVLAPRPGDRTIGFKEIRNTDAMMKPEDFPAYVRFILNSFPGARIIFNTRDAEAVANSGWFKSMPRDKVLNRIANSDVWFRQAAKEHERCFLIDYAEVVENGERLDALHRFLGAEHDRAATAQMLAVPLTHLKSPIRKKKSGLRRLLRMGRK